MKPAYVVGAGVLLTAIMPQASPQGGADAVEVLRGVQTHYNAVRSLVADFTEESRSSAIGRSTTAHGVMRIKKLGKMRWDYAGRDEHSLYVNNSGIYLYVRSEGTVYQSNLPNGSCASVGLEFLAGTVNLAKDYIPTLGAGGRSGEERIVLAPKKRGTPLRSFALDVFGPQHVLRGFRATNDAGDTWNFRFSNLRENVAFQDSIFVFRRPVGTEVLSFRSECGG